MCWKVALVVVCHLASALMLQAPTGSLSDTPRISVPPPTTPPLSPSSLPPSPSPPPLPPTTSTATTPTTTRIFNISHTSLLSPSSTSPSPTTTGFSLTSSTNTNTNTNTSTNTTTTSGTSQNNRHNRVLILTKAIPTSPMTSTISNNAPTITPTPSATPSTTPSTTTTAFTTTTRSITTTTPSIAIPSPITTTTLSNTNILSPITTSSNTSSTKNPSTISTTTTTTTLPMTTTTTLPTTFTILHQPVSGKERREVAGLPPSFPSALLPSTTTLLGPYEDETVYPENNAYFSQENNTELTAQAGTTATLHCVAHNVGENMVSWIRRRDYHLITVGRQTYSSDQRFQVTYAKNNNDWQLHIRYAQVHDAGVYECQVSSHPPISLFSKLNVVEAVSEILGGPEKYMKTGSTLRLVCVLRQNTETPSYVFWYQNNHMINYDTSRLVTVENDGNLSVLYLLKVGPKDSGNYTCVPSDARPSSILIHVLHGGETSEAIKSGASSTYSSFLRFLHPFRTHSPLALSRRAPHSLPKGLGSALLEALCPLLLLISLALHVSHT